MISGFALQAMARAFVSHRPQHIHPAIRSISTSHSSRRSRHAIVTGN
jgi:hypothetical protein